MKHLKKLIILFFSNYFSLNIFAADPVIVLKTTEGEYAR